MLTLVTLEWGGKSPVVVVTDSADLDVTAPADRAERPAELRADLHRSGLCPGHQQDRRPSSPTRSWPPSAQVPRATEQDRRCASSTSGSSTGWCPLISATDGKVVTGGGSDNGRACGSNPTVIVDPVAGDPGDDRRDLRPHPARSITVDSLGARRWRTSTPGPKPLALYVFTASHQGGRQFDRPDAVRWRSDQLCRPAPPGAAAAVRGWWARVEWARTTVKWGFEALSSSSGGATKPTRSTRARRTRHTPRRDQDHATPDVAAT